MNVLNSVVENTPLLEINNADQRPLVYFTAESSGRADVLALLREKFQTNFDHLSKSEVETLERALVREASGEGRNLGIREILFLATDDDNRPLLNRDAIVSGKFDVYAPEEQDKLLVVISDGEKDLYCLRNRYVPSPSPNPAQ